MPPIEKYLPVPWFEQQTLDFCGPAVAQMFLQYRGVTATQTALWSEIQGSSAGTGSGPPVKDFPSQVCDDCGHDPRGHTIWRSWNTTPEALQQTVQARLPAVPLAVKYPDQFDKGTEMLVRSLDRNPDVPPFATVYAINHWVIVVGYLRDDLASTAFPPVAIGPYQLNGLYILDPQEDPRAQRVRLVAIGSAGAGASPPWSEQFGLITCGPHIDCYPVVVASDPPPPAQRRYR
jgi:hypothetical protein